MVHLYQGLAIITSLESIDVNFLSEKVLIFLKRVVADGEPIIWWTHSFLEARESLGFLHVGLHLFLHI